MIELIEHEKGSEEEARDRRRLPTAPARRRSPRFGKEMIRRKQTNKWVKSKIPLTFYPHLQTYPNIFDSSITNPTFPRYSI